MLPDKVALCIRISIRAKFVERIDVHGIDRTSKDIIPECLNGVFVFRVGTFEIPKGQDFIILDSNQT